MSYLESTDPQIHSIIQHETERQITKLQLIASENYASPSVMEASGSVLTNKYAEGYPGKRYYGGCEFVDQAEDLARERLKQLFGAEYANVQPHSGATANQAIYFSFVKPGDTVLGMDLAHGGHLTHGSPVNFSGQLYRMVSYGVNRETGMIDYDEVLSIAEREKPKLLIVGASSYSRNISYAKFREIADKVGAFLWADIAHPAGLIATKLLDDPVPHCHVVTSTTHKTLRGPRGGLIIMHKDWENPFGIVMAKSGRVKMMSEILDSTVMPGIQGGPLMHIIAAKAVAFGEALQPSYAAYTRQVKANAVRLAELLVARGFELISGGTDNHLMLIDLHNKGVTGKDTENAMERAGITLNKNMVPFDDRSPFVTSGIRVGAAAVTTRGFKEQDMEFIADKLDTVVSNVANEAVLDGVRAEIREYCSRFPLYTEIQS
ncbi:MAG: serine hydroxymethyltransferase [Ignavibacteriae bacterium]|nr:serine hydroxymethyltransferase [Ignavibacteriota bacterium]